MRLRQVLDIKRDHFLSLLQLTTKNRISRNNNSAVKNSDASLFTYLLDDMSVRRSGMCSIATNDIKKKKETSTDAYRET